MEMSIKIKNKKFKIKNKEGEKGGFSVKWLSELG
jgi:hypothetical protein